jgi:hypothetical protein
MTKDEFERIIQEKPIPEFVQEYLFDGVPYCFKDNPNIFNTFRQTICSKFNIHPQNLTIVGSAKIGFSLSPDKYGRPFSDASDIDVVLVSEELFQDLWLKLIEFKKTTVYRLNKYHQNRFYELQAILFYGSIRLDMISSDFPFAREWWEFFNILSTDKRFGPRQVRAMIFKSWRHVSYYYESGIRKVKEQHESNRV